MKRHWSLVAFCCLTLLEVSICSAGGTGKNKAADYYPLQVGNQWTYKLNANGKEVTMVTKIAKIETIDGVPLARLDAEVEGNVAATEHLRQTEKGIFRHRTNGIEAVPPLLLLKYPVRAGDKWGGEFAAGGGKAKYTSEAQEEEITVPAGKFKTIRVAIKIDENGQITNTTYWFARDVGFVKQTVDTGTLNVVLELQKYDRKGK